MKKIIFKNSGFVLMIIMLCLCFLSGCGATTETISVDSIQISKKNVYLAEGQTTVLSAQVYPFNANNQNIVWASSDESIVKVEDGFVTAIKKGEAVIEVLSEEGGYKDTCNILVTTASDNLALNNYNNLNMPPKELEPIYNNASNTSVKNRKSVSQIAKNLTTKASAQVTDIKQSAKNVVADIKNELSSSINQLNEQKNHIAQNMSANTKNDSFANMFNVIQTEIYNGITNIKQNMLKTLEQAEEKIDSEEYTTQSQNINGVTFVVISNNQND